MQRPLVSVLVALTLLPACGDDKGDDGGSTGGTGAATPGDTGEATTATPTTGGAGTTDATTGEAPPSGPPVCQEACGSDADCTQFGGVDNGFACVRDRCGQGCADDMACMVKFSFWAVDCGAPDGCPNQACVDIGGQGKCAQVPSDQIDCAALGQAEVMLPQVGGGTVTVCANTLYKCDGGLCDSQCTSDAECLTPGLGRCDVATGQCVCVDDAGCTAASSSTPKCSPLGFCGCGSDANCGGSQFLATCSPEGFCGCETDADCVGAQLGDTCTDGRCGCSGAAACTSSKNFDGTEFVCE